MTIRGFRDRWDYETEFDLEYQFLMLSRTLGFTHLDTPVVEKTSLFNRSVGEETDIISKEIYSFEDRSGNQISLRPEFTAGVMRAVLANLGNFKKYLNVVSSGSVFRYDRPQAGRYRQFRQFNCESFGISSPENDFFIINVAQKIIDICGIDVELKINSLGSNEAKSKYAQELQKYLTPFTDKLSEESQKRLTKNPLRILDSKSPVDQDILQNAPEFNQFLSDNEAERFSTLLKYLETSGIKFSVDSSLVRGLDYYTSTVFEFIDNSNGLTVLAGGRYDNLAKTISGKHDIPAVGFGCGMERIMLSKKEQQKEQQKIAVIMHKSFSTHWYEAILKMSGGIGTELITNQKNILSGIQIAESKSCSHCIVIGENEISSGTASLKCLATRTEFPVKISDKSLPL